MEKKSSGFGVAALVLGIIAMVGCFIPYLNIVSFFLAFLAVIFAIVSLCKKASKAISIAAIILSVLAFIIGITINSATSAAIDETSKELDKTLGNSTDEVLKNDVEVTLGDLNITTDEYGFTDSEMVVTVKNKTSEQKSYSIHVEAVDASGNRIKDDYIYVNDLGPGQTTTEKIFEYIPSDKTEAMKNATFKIVEASSY